MPPDHSRTAKGKRPRPPIKTEAIGPLDAFAKPAPRELTPQERRSAHQTYLPLMGGPLDGGLFRVPVQMLREKGDVEIPVVIPPESTLVGPNGKPIVRFAYYRLDRTAPPRLRFTRTGGL